MRNFQYLSQTLTKWRDAMLISPPALSALVILFIFAADNATYWSIGQEVFAGHPLSFAGFALAVFCLLFAVFSLFSFPWLVKPFLIFMVLLSAVTSYYMDQLGVIIDRDMIQNVMVTTVTESKHLITLGFVSHVLIFGILPAVLVSLVRVKRHRAIRTIAVPLLSSALCFALTAGFLLADLKSYSAILRERKDFMSSFQPGAPLVGAIRYAKMMTHTANVTVAALGEDATKGPAFAKSKKPVLTIVIAGETARAQNFSLNGYEVETNPKLAKLPIVNFRDVNSCGTATAVSLPCMFSKFDRDGYSYEKGVSNQNVLDVLSHAGMHVEWWDNNTGDKGLAARVNYRALTHSDNAEFCPTGECIDGIFMQHLKDYAASITEDSVLVLHQIGSHGPTYYLRYPEGFEPFKPSCKTAEFKNCSPEEITNAYNNTIAYTDEVLAQTIAFLEAETELSTALIYVSDHGESLGENGLYLHGAPYFMAPEVQTKVPMLLWMSRDFQDRFEIDQACLRGKQDETLSHDNLFHSLLGMLDIQTDTRNPALDIFASCKASQRIALQ